MRFSLLLFGITVKVQKDYWSYWKIMANNVFGLGEGGDFYHWISYEAPHYNYTKNCHTKHCTATFAKPMLADGVLSSVSSCATFLLSYKLSECLSFVGCALAKKLKHRREGRKKMNFFMGRAGTLFCKLWSVLGLVAVCKCVWLLHRLLVFPNNTQNSFISPCRYAVFVKNWILIVVFV